MFDPLLFFRYLKRPYYTFSVRERTNVFSSAIKLYLVSVLILGLINSLNLTVLRSFLALPVDETLIIPGSMKDRLWLYAVLVIIVSPVIEEVVFRLPLIFEPVFIALSLSVIVTALVHKVSNNTFSAIVFLILFYLIYKLASINKSKLLFFWQRNFKMIFYVFSIAFGLVHIGNYHFTEPWHYFLAPVLVFPQIVIGFILSFTRLYYYKGFLICIIFHILLNLVSLSIFLLDSRLI